MWDDDTQPQCCNDYTHGPAIGSLTTGARMMPELADIMGDGGLVEDINLLCADCLTGAA